MFISDNGLQFSFFVASLSGFGIRVMVISQNEFRSLPSSAILWKSLSRIGVNSSLNVCQNSPVKTSVPALLFVGRFLITLLVSMLVMGLLRFFSFAVSKFLLLRYRKILGFIMFILETVLNFILMIYLQILSYILCRQSSSSR